MRRVVGVVAALVATLGSIGFPQPLVATAAPRTFARPDMTPGPGSTLLAWGATGWAYSLDGGASQRGQAPFGSGGGCVVQQGVKTPWPSGVANLEASHTVPIPSTKLHIVVRLSVDNDADISWNGHYLTSVTHDGCPGASNFLVNVPAADLAKGRNLLAISARDRGSETYLNAAVQVNYGGTLRFRGSPVQTQPSNVYLIFWEPTGDPIPPNLESTVSQFSSDINGSALWDTLAQYYDKHPSRHVSNQVSLAATDVVTDALNPSNAESIVLREVAGHLWPTGDTNYYVIMLPPDAPCGGGVHGYSSASLVVWASTSCQAGFPATTPNGAYVDNTINVLFHELAEMTLSPHGSTGGWSGTKLLPPPNDNGLPEVADICQSGWLGALLPDGSTVNLNGRVYTVQPLWSNLDNGCTWRNP